MEQQRIEIQERHLNDIQVGRTKNRFVNVEQTQDINQMNTNRIYNPELVSMNTSHSFNSNISKVQPSAPPLSQSYNCDKLPSYEEL